MASMRHEVLGAEVARGSSGAGRRAAGPVPAGGERALDPRVSGVPGRRVGAPRGRRDPVRPGGRPLGPGAPPRRPAGGADCGGRARAAGAAPGAVRLTRRGRRLAVVLALAGVALCAVLLPGALVGGAGGGLELVGGSSVVVRPGDTLWSIATAEAGDAEDVRAVVDAIERLNRLDSSVLMPGQVLVLP